MIDAASNPAADAVVSVPAPAELPDNIAAFRADAANTNEKPIYIGRLMLFSDQDLTALKHNLIYTAVVSTVFVGLIGILSDNKIPLVWRSLFLGTVLTGLHSACIAAWNLMQSFWQVHPQFSPASVCRWAAANRARLIVSVAIVATLVYTLSPMVADSFMASVSVVTERMSGPPAPVAVKAGH